MRDLLASGPDREEAALDEFLAGHLSVTRANTIAVVSPKGGVGKTTCTFLLGNLFAGAANLRCVALDANPDLGTLGSLAPHRSRLEGTLTDVVDRMDRIECAAELKPLVAALPTGLHLISAPGHTEAMAQITPELLTRLTAFLGRFYEVILFDLGAGMAGALARFALEKADGNMVVSTADFVTASTVLDSLRQLHGQRLTMVLNQAPQLPDDAGRRQIEEALRHQGLDQHVIVPYDDVLRAMLDSGTYDLAALDRDTRVSIKELGRSAATWLV